MIANKPIVAFDVLPDPWKRGEASLRYEKIEKARARAANYYHTHPDDIGLKWVPVWEARNATSADKVYVIMSTSVFRPLRGDRYRWVLARRKERIYAMMTLRNTEEMTPEQYAKWTEHLAKVRKGRSTELNEVAGRGLDEPGEENNGTD